MKGKKSLDQALILEIAIAILAITCVRLAIILTSELVPSLYFVAPLSALLIVSLLHQHRHISLANIDSSLFRFLGYIGVMILISFFGFYALIPFFIALTALRIFVFSILSSHATAAFSFVVMIATAIIALGTAPEYLPFGYPHRDPNRFYDKSAKHYQNSALCNKIKPELVVNKALVTNTLNCKFLYMYDEQCNSVHPYQQVAWTHLDKDGCLSCLTKLDFHVKKMIEECRINAKSESVE